MSHTVTVTRTTTTTTTSALIINTGYLKTWPGILKLLQLLLGIIIVGLVGFYFEKDRARGMHINIPELFMLLIAVTFMLGTLILLTSCIISISTASIISKTIYEVLYHGFAFVLLLAAGLTLLIEANHGKDTYYYQEFVPYLVASIIALVLSGLYLFSTLLANRSYRGL